MTIGIMDSTSSSVEALGLNYLRYGLLVAVNNLWTLAALFTAAVSFWRFNLLPSLARRHCLLKSSSPSSSSSSVFAYEFRQQQPPTFSRPLVDSHQSISATLFPMEEMSNSGSVVKGNRVYSRFCFGNDVVFHRHNHDDEEEEEEESFRRAIQEEDKTLRFDVMKRLRLSDLGFYDYQDIRVLDGNVVKFWDWDDTGSARSSIWR